MRIYIEALELVLSPEELKEKIPPEKLKSLKGKGVLQAYTLAHEGESRPRVIGEGTQNLRWPRAVIKSLAKKIQAGLKFFVGHRPETNEHTNRESVGEVVSSFVKEIGGRLSNVIIGWFPNEEPINNMDVCSMEADIHTDEENIVGDINEITGIALGNSERDHPAFPGALRLGMVQCFGDDNGNDKNNPKPGEGDKTMTFEEVKKAISDLNIHPWQIFTLDDLKNDRVFGKVFEENSTIKAENERLTSENEKIQKESKDAIRKSQVSDAGKTLDTMLAEGYTDKQKKFIKSRFNPESLEDLTEEGLKSFVDEQKKDFAETAKLFGVTEESSDKSGGDETATTGSPEELEEEALKLMGVKE